MKKMTTSKSGKDLIKSFEGLRLDAYLCPAGVPTIGWGHTKGVRLGQRITLPQAEDLLVEDLAPCERILNAMGVNFRQEQFDALTSFIFNVGTGNFSASTLRKKILNDAPDEDIAMEFTKWIYSNKIALPGLIGRRVLEANMFLGYEMYKVEKGKIVEI